MKIAKIEINITEGFCPKTPVRVKEGGANKLVVLTHINPKYPLYKLVNKKYADVAKLETALP